MSLAPPPPGLLPRLSDLVTQLVEACGAAGIQLIVPPDGGARTTARILALFQRGRALQNGIWVPVDPVHRTGIVTYALPATAPHAIRVDLDGTVGSAACDCAVTVNGKIAWNPEDAGYGQYQTFGAIAEGLGLVWGGHWPGHLVDLDHVELADWRSLPLATEEEVPHDSIA